MKRLVLPLLIGLFGFAVASAAMYWHGQLLVSTQVAISDFLMVNASGPRFGIRPVRDDIVLVLFDYPSAQRLGYVHSYRDDAELYRQLSNSGAKVIFDTRMIAAASPDAFAEIQPLLNEMLSINDEGRLLRDVWLSTDLLTSNGSTYENLLVQNVINSHPHALPEVNSRLYPLTYFVSSGPRESAALMVCRQVWDSEPATSAKVGIEMRRCGIMSVWHQYSPELVPPTDIPQTPYQVDGHSIVWHPFLSTTSLVPPAAFWISYDPPLEDYKRFSYSNVSSMTHQEFADKIVLIGFSADIDPTAETYSVPNFEGKACAAEVMACAIQTLLDGRNMRVIPAKITWPVMALMCMAMALIGGLAKPIQATLLSVLMLFIYFAFAVWAYRSGWYSDCFVAPTTAAATGITAGIANAWLGLRSRQHIVDLFGRYVPRAVVHQLIQRPELERLMMGGVRRDVTVMFADIRGFTDFSQDLSPEDVVHELNSMLEVMVDCTFEHEGTLDKFIGDAILVLFNAPLDQPDHVERAVRTAVSIQHRLDGHKSGLRVGIGIHRGDAVVGNIGTPQRLEYTAIGSTVNIASRICGTAKPGEVVVSDTVLANLPSGFDTEPLGTVQAKGIKEPLNVTRVRQGPVRDDLA